LSLEKCGGAEMAQMSKILKDVRQTYSTFSGADIVLMMGGTEIGGATAYVVNVSRDKVPQYVFGDPDPKAFTRGARHVSGQLTGLMLHEDSFIDALKACLQSPDSYIYKVGTEFIKHRMAIGGITGNVTEMKIDDGFLTALLKFKPLYLDELPPIDLLVVGVNEFGAAAKSEVIGAEFTSHSEAFNSQTTAGIEQASFIARAYVPWQPIKQ
jgi:hypothetical protein